LRGANLPPDAQKFLDSSSPAALSDAPQQVGLKLESRKSPLDTIVIDGALKTPTANQAGAISTHGPAVGWCGQAPPPAVGRVNQLQQTRSVDLLSRAPLQSSPRPIIFLKALYKEI
jgi:hypothetical protein